MKDIIILDRVLHIVNKEGYTDITPENGLLEKLSDMLDNSGVKHSFTLAKTEDIDRIEKQGKEYIATLYYSERDEVSFLLAFMLWGKIYRGFSDTDILKVMGKHGIAEKQAA